MAATLIRTAESLWLITTQSVSESTPPRICVFSDPGQNFVKKQNQGSKPYSHT